MNGNNSQIVKPDQTKVLTDIKDRGVVDTSINNNVKVDKEPTSVKDDGSLSARPSNTLRVYGCGGTGTNIIRPYFKHSGALSELFATINPVVLDASDSDITKDIPPEYIYLVEGASSGSDVLKGGGKKRNLNYDDIKLSIKSMLLQHEPGDFNIVVHSNSGASGSVIGPLVVSELLSRGHQVVVLMVGSTSSEIEVKNNKDTLLSYEYQAANIHKKPILAIYKENSPETPMKAVDNDMQTIIGLLSILTSGRNRKLDRTDMTHFLDYTKVSEFQPSLTSLDIFGPSVVLGKNEVLIGVVTLTNEHISHELDVPKYYQAVGILPNNSLDNVNSELPLNFCTIKGKFNPIVDKMKTILGQYSTSRTAVVEKTILANDVNANEDGMIM